MARFECLFYNRSISRARVKPMKFALQSLILPAVLGSLLAACAEDETRQWPPLVDAGGGYETAPLEKDVVVVKVVQNLVRNMEDFADPQAGLAENLQRMEHWIEVACSEGGKPDFILFNEFPLTGYSRAPRDEKLDYTIRIPGPETDRLGELARSCDSYIIFGSYARDDEWPGHILSINTVIDRQGEIAAEFWKSRNIKRFGTEAGDIPTTTVENVYDRYLDRYGEEQLIPVLRTEFGNIAVSTVQLDPFVFAAFAMRGVEIMFRTATLFSETDVKAIARYNNMYSAMCNIIFPDDSPAASLGGNSLIVGPDGTVLAQATGNFEAVIEAEIPIAEFRAGRGIHRYPLEMLQPVFSQYRGEIPLNHLDLPPEQLPRTRLDMTALLDRASRWLNR